MLGGKLLDLNLDLDEYVAVTSLDYCSDGMKRSAKQKNNNPKMTLSSNSLLLLLFTM